MLKAENLKIRLFGLFWPKSGLFRQKEDQVRSIFLKWSAIRPRSDKADLLGSTAFSGALYHYIQPRTVSLHSAKHCATTSS